MDKKRTKPVPENKKRIVEKLQKLFSQSASFLIVSVKSLPGSQFQAIKKKLRGKAEVVYVKKSLLILAIEKAGMKEILPYVKEDCAFLFSKLDLFELSLMLSENKTAVRAKVGQIAPDDITVEAGPTELVPGPVISELGALGLKIEIVGGKINIRERKIIVKQGEGISENASGIMAKFDMKPFFVGFIPLVAFDLNEKKIYKDIIVERDKIIDQIKYEYGKALAFAVSISYPVKETILLILAKAGMQEKAIENLINKSQQNSGG